MIYLFLGWIYGVGFGLTMVGGLIYLMVLRGLKCHPSKVKLLLGLVIWPITWVVVGIRLYQIFYQEFDQ